MTERIRDGVFFEAPEKLPRGRHDLGRDQVRAVQRERLMIAITELLAERGYLAIGIREISTRAGVSRAAFYQCFADKEECAFSAFDRFNSVLQARVAATVDGCDDWDLFVTLMLGAYLSALQDDVAVARAFQVEIDGLGHPARSRRRSSLRQLAGLLQACREKAFGEESNGAAPSEEAYLAIVHAVWQAACDRLDEQPEPDLVGLVPELAGWVGRAFAPPDALIPAEIGPIVDGRER